MKNYSHRFFLIVAALCISSNSFAQNEAHEEGDIYIDDEYDVSTIDDLSIERRLIQHDGEINSLGNYFESQNQNLSIKVHPQIEVNITLQKGNRNR